MYFQSVFLQTGSWLFTSMVCGILLNFVDNFYLTVIFYVVFMCSAICSSIIMAVAVNLYPTNCRAMATSFIMLFGRLGSANGSSVIGLMLPHHCTMIFYVFGGVFISKCIHILFQHFSLITLSRIETIYAIFFRLCIGFCNDKNKATIAACHLQMTKFDFLFQYEL